MCVLLIYSVCFKTSLYDVLNVDIGTHGMQCVAINCQRDGISVKICRCETIWVKLCRHKIFVAFTCFSIHVKMRVLLRLI